MSLLYPWAYLATPIKKRILKRRNENDKEMSLKCSISLSIMEKQKLKL